MKWFDYAAPQSVAEAAALLAEHGERARVLAGGTDLLVQMRIGRREPGLVVDVKNIPELIAIDWDPGSGADAGRGCALLSRSPPTLAFSKPIPAWSRWLR